MRTQNEKLQIIPHVLTIAMNLEVANGVVNVSIWEKTIIQLWLMWKSYLIFEPTKHDDWDYF